MVPHLKLASHAARQSLRKLLLPASRHNEVCEKWSLVSERPGIPPPGCAAIPDDRLTDGFRTAALCRRAGLAGARPFLAIDRSAPLSEFERIVDQYPVFRVA